VHIAKKIKSNGNIKDACRESGRPLQSQKHHQRRPVEAGRYKFEGYVKIEGEARLRCHGGTYGGETNATQLLDTTRMPILAFATPDSHNCVVSAVRASQFMNSRLLKASLQCATVVLLLFAVAGLSTLAKNSQYFSKSNPAHYVNIATKMTESHLPAVINRTPQLPVARFVPPQPEMQITQVVRAEIPALPSIGVTVSLQHRSPPISLS
jgi:hypothetical protein